MKECKCLFKDSQWKFKNTTVEEVMLRVKLGETGLIANLL